MAVELPTEWITTGISGGFNAVLSGVIVWQAKAMLAESQANRKAFTEAMDTAKKAFETEVTKCHAERTDLTNRLITLLTRPHNQRKDDLR